QGQVAKKGERSSTVCPGCRGRPTTPPAQLKGWVRPPACQAVSVCGILLSRVPWAINSLDWGPCSPHSRTFINLTGPFTNKRKEYSERRIIG
uniref:Uncharacterized protein n=1 Tax=Chrysemys picta bellii TaxID=8478 RepID=A0A8C3HJV5_CHRPI